MQLLSTYSVPVSEITGNKISEAAAPLGSQAEATGVGDGDPKRGHRASWEPVSRVLEREWRRIQSKQDMHRPKACWEKATGQETKEPVGGSWVGLAPSWDSASELSEALQRRWRRTRRAGVCLEHLQGCPHYPQEE